MSHPDPTREPRADPPTVPLAQSPPLHGESAHDQPRQEPTTYEPTGYEPTGYEPTGYEPTTYEPTGYEPTAYEPIAYHPIAYHPIIDAAPVPAPYPPVPVGPSHVYAVPVVPRKSVGVAITLEIVLGLFGVFGIGCMYAGRIGLGLALMVSFWVLFWVNLVLVFILIGLVTMPLTWIAYLAVGALLAARAVERHNSEGLYH